MAPNKNTGESLGRNSIYARQEPMGALPESRIVK